MTSRPAAATARPMIRSLTVAFLNCGVASARTQAETAANTPLSLTIMAGNWVAIPGGAAEGSPQARCRRSPCTGWRVRGTAYEVPAVSCRLARMMSSVPAGSAGSGERP